MKESSVEKDNGGDKTKGDENKILSENLLSLIVWK